MENHPVRNYVLYGASRESKLKFHHCIDKYNNETDLLGNNYQHRYSHTHPFYEIYFYISGDCAMNHDGVETEMKPGCVVISRPDQFHGVKINPPTLYERFFLYITPGYFNFLPSAQRRTLDAFFDEAGLDIGTLRLSDENHRRCIDLLYDTSRALSGKNRDPGALATANTIKLLTLLYHEMHEDNEHRVNSSDSLISEIIRYVNENYPQIKGVGEVAEQFHISKVYLSRLFRQRAHITLVSYLQLKRLDCAKRLLEEGVDVTEVCYRSGFENYSYFISVFGERFGVTPHKYRQRFCGSAEA